MNCAALNLSHLQYSISFSLSKMLAILKTRKRKLLSCVFTFHKTWNKAVSHRSLAVIAKKCTKKCDAHAKLLLNLAEARVSKYGFQKKYSRALNMSYTFQPLMSSWIINIACSIASALSLICCKKWLLIISQFPSPWFFYNEYMYLPPHCSSYQQNIKGKKKNAILIFGHYSVDLWIKSQCCFN